jgi:hypothetical protein
MPREGGLTAPGWTLGWVDGQGMTWRGEGSLYYRSHRLAALVDFRSLSI